MKTLAAKWVAIGAVVFALLAVAGVRVVFSPDEDLRESTRKELLREGYAVGIAKGVADAKRPAIERASTSRTALAQRVARTE